MLLSCRPSQLVLQSLHRRSKLCPVPLLHCLPGFIELRSRLRQGRLRDGSGRLR